MAAEVGKKYEVILWERSFDLCIIFFNSHVRIWRLGVKKLNFAVRWFGTELYTVAGTVLVPML